MKKEEIIPTIFLFIVLFGAFVVPIVAIFYDEFGIWGAIVPSIILLCFIFIRVVPRNTAIIVDRCTHYNKTVRRGIYIKVPFIDSITTKISTNTLVKNYSEVYETDDSKFIRFNYSVWYKAPDIEAVLSHLAADRRSIDDIIKCSLQSTVKAYTSKDGIIEIANEAYSRTALNCSAFGIDIHKLTITGTLVATQAEVFKPHIHRDDGPISYR